MDSYRETEQRQDRERERERERASRYYDDRDDDDRGARSRRAGANSDTRESSYAYPEDDLDDFPRRRREDARRDDDYRSPVNPRDSSGALPYPPAGGDSRALTMPGAYDFKDDDRPSRSEYRTVSPPADSPYRSSKDKVDPGRDSRVRYSHYRDEERPSRAGKAPEFAADEQFKFLPQKYSKSVQKTEPPRDDRRYDERRRRRDDSDSESDDSYDDDDDDDDDPRSQQRFNRGYEDARRRHDAEQEDRRRQTRDGGEPERRHRFQMRGPSPPSDKPKKKAQLEDDLAYGKMAGEEPSIRQTAQQAAKSFSKTEQDLLSKFGYSGHGSGYPPEKKTARFDPADDPRRSSSNVLTVEPGDRRRGDRDRSPAPPTNKMSSLSVNTGHHSFNMSLGAAPPSPLQEAYHGTYQSCSPMPSPLMLPNHGGNEIVEVTPLSLSDEDARINRRARFHVPEVVAEKMAKALKGDRRSPDTEILIQILPGLSHEEVMELRTQYKTLVKAGSERKGVNVAKHIRSRLKDEDPNLMKACYATALGRWESEAYWANYWYQGDKTRRELLIESLMGRSNGEMRMIKDGFSDKKYNDSLTKCMKTELREDKFKKAVILALGEERMEDVDEYGRPLEVNMRLVSQDVEDLRRSVKSEKGGETLMISIVVLRSDAHLREILKLYSQAYKTNFARDALHKSTNLVVRGDDPLPLCLQRLPITPENAYSLLLPRGDC